MDRLGKMLPACLNRACYARTSKHGLTYCKWKGYVNCFSAEFRQTRCSCIATKQFSREYVTARNGIQASSHVLAFKTHNDQKWSLLLPTNRGYEQKREFSSSNEEGGNDGKDGKKDEEEKTKEKQFYQFGRACARASVFWALTAMFMSTISFRNISWAEFERDYLIAGKVKQVNIYASVNGPQEEIAVVSLHPQASQKETEVIVHTEKGEFQQKLEQFEQMMHVPYHEQIQARTSSGYFWGEVWSMVTVLTGFIFVLNMTAAGIAFSLSKGHLRNNMKLYQELMKQDPAARKKNIEVIKKRREAAMNQGFNKRNNEEEVDGPKRHNASKTTEEEKKESFADMVRESIFQDKKFKIKRGDLIMKDKLSMKDVAGLHEPKVEIIEFVDYVKNPERFQILGAKTPRGALLLGPPGCGKTLLAKALAAECGVPFYFIAASELDDMIVGVGSQRVRALFKKAREQSPCIIYIDELDAIGMRRAATDKGQSNNDKEMTLNQLLAEMDGMHSREGVIVLASTNRADMLDKALLRPGRFDRHISIDLPTFKERIELFDLYLAKLSLNNPISTYSTRLAQLTPGMSGADISYICNEAAIHAARNNQKKVTAQDFEYAVERKIAGAAKATNTVGVFEKKVIAYHESGHALVGWLLEHTDALLKVTIVPRTSGVGGFAQYLPQENKLYSKEHLFDIICMALGGRVAENVIFDHLSTGAQDDLRRVTGMAYAQIRSFGMSESFGLVSYPDDQQGLKPFSKQVSNMLDLEARQLVSSAHKRTEELLRANTDKLHKLAALLLERETISAQDVEDLIGPPAYGEKQMFDPLTFYDDELRSGEKAKN